MSTYFPSAVVPAIPVQGPQLSLITSAMRPDNASDPRLTDLSEVPAAQRANLPDALLAELNERVGETWVRGYAYQPEQHGAIQIRDACDDTSADTPGLPAPAGLALTRLAGGTLSAATYAYVVTAINENGHTLPSAEVTLAVAASSQIELTWNPVEDDVTYKVYGRVHGSLGLLATVGPFSTDVQPSWTDTGAGSPGAAPPNTDTSAGPSYTYVNPDIVTVVPYLLVAEDSCSTWGWEEHDYKGRANRWLDAGAAQAIEREFWTGALAQAKTYPNNYLCNSASYTDLTPGGTPPSVARGQQILQDALQQCGLGGRGMLHVQAQTTTDLFRVRRVGKLMMDLFDNLVVPGVGYTGVCAGIGTPGAGTAVMFATDMVSVRLEQEAQVFPDTMAEAVDRGQAGFPNTATYRAEKFGVASFDGACHFGIRVTLAT